MTKIAVLGSGQVGQVLAKGFKKHGYDVRIGTRTPAKLADFSSREGIVAGTFQDAAGWGDAIVLAVAGGAAESALQETGTSNLAGKIVMDVTNPIAAEPPQDGVLRFFTGSNDSLMERLQASYPAARFVKFFSSVGNALMVDPNVPGGRPTMFYCGNDAEAKAQVARVIEQFGWEPADMGTARAAGPIERLCQLWCIPGFRENSWTHAFKLVRR
jgi:hypothetical protein